MCSRFDCMRRRHASPSGTLRWHPSGTVRATPAVIRFSRSINPICTASLTKPPSELKKIGRSRFAKSAKNSRNRCAAPSSNLPSAVIHSVQPRPQAFGSPVAITKISGSLWPFARRRSSSLGSALAAIATTGRQQSAAATQRINLRIIIPLRAEHRREIVLCLERPLDATGPVGVAHQGTAAARWRAIVLRTLDRPQQAQTRPIAGIPRPRQLAPCSSAREPAPSSDTLRRSYDFGITI